MSKKSHLEFTLKPDIFPMYIHVLYSNDQERSKAYYRKMTGEKDLNLQPEHKDASAARFGHHIILQFNQDIGSDPSALAAMVAHEAVHASWYFESALGNIFTDTAQEGQTYIVQYLVENITRTIWNYIRKKTPKRKKVLKSKSK